MDPVNVDINYLTPRELKDLWDNAGLSLDDLDNPMAADDPVQAFVALAWIVARRDNPDLTLEEAWDIPIDLADGDGPDPTPAGSS